MKTKIIRADARAARERALQLLRAGELIALPTDTVYGIAADGLNAVAIEKIFVAKGRPSDKAIPLLLGDARDVETLVIAAPPLAHALMEKFWPGSLTIVLHAREIIPSVLRAKGDTVALRVPAHPLVRELARELGHPLAATSANLSGGPNPTSAGEVEAQLGGRIPLILDGGSTSSNLASTVIDLTTDPPRVLRVGALSLAEIEKVLGIKLSNDAA